MKTAEIKTTHLYRMRMKYTRGWSVELGKAEESESQHFFLGEGRCEGRITGNFQAANHPLRRTDGTFLRMYKARLKRKMELQSILIIAGMAEVTRQANARS